MNNEKTYLSDMLQHENNFEKLMGEVETFWQSGVTWHFPGVDDVSIECIKFISSAHDKVIVIVTGIMDSYLRYQELIYDLFQQGYDVMLLDHRGQGLSGRILKKRKRVYVNKFSDYVDDLMTFWQKFVLPEHHQKRYLLGHSMGGAITTLFLQRQPEGINAVALTAPMIGINLPFPFKWVKILTWMADQIPALSKGYAVYRFRVMPYRINMLSHSPNRYRYIVYFFNKYPEVYMQGPTWHWVREAIKACEQIQQKADKLTVPLLTFQSGKEKIVSNKSIDYLHKKRLAAGTQTLTPYLTADNAVYSCKGDGLIVFHQASHEILFETDEIRSAAIQALLRFFTYNS